MFAPAGVIRARVVDGFVLAVARAGLHARGQGLRELAMLRLFGCPLRLRRRFKFATGRPMDRARVVLTQPHGGGILLKPSS